MESTGLRVGLVPLARPTFDTALAAELTDQLRAVLKQAGFAVVGPSALVSNLEETNQAAQALVDQPLDVLLAFQATFADSSMVKSLAQAIEAPILLWAVPEASTGGRLRLNSFCGINLGAHALRRAGYSYHTVYTQPDDTSALDQVRTVALAGRARRLLQQTRIGLLGERPTGYESCEYDREALARIFGLDVVQFDLEEFFQDVRQADEQAVDSALEGLSSRLDNLSQLDQAALRGTLGSYVIMKQLATQEQLDGLAVRCWPEFFTELGCAACGAMSMLSDELTTCSCEADVNGTITQLILQWLSNEAAFGTDVVSIDVDQDVVVLWHCGVAPLSMADPEAPIKGTVHSNRKLPLTMEFPLKPGRVTVARLSEADGDYRLVVGGGEMLRAPLSFSGTSGVLRFDRPANEVLDIILGEGLEHHVSLTYGDYVPALETLSGILDIPILHL